MKKGRLKNFTFPSKFKGLLVGAGGSNLKKLTELYPGIDFSIPDDGNDTIKVGVNETYTVEVIQSILDDQLADFKRMDSHIMDQALRKQRRKPNVGNAFLLTVNWRKAKYICGPFERLGSELYKNNQLPLKKNMSSEKREFESVWYSNRQSYKRVSKDEQKF